MSMLLDFDREGRWDHQRQSGPAIHTPDYVKAILVNIYQVEWLNLSIPSQGFYAKNHMVVNLKFVTPMRIYDKLYLAARVSMELGVEKKVKFVGRENWLPGSHYFPGEYTVELLTYASVSRRSVHENTFPLRHGTTIGRLIDKVIARKMHHFCFLPYTVEGRWKGCGDHVLHCWALFVREGDITNENSFEEPNMPLSAALTYTYAGHGRRTWELIGRGWWVSHNPVSDRHTPESVFSDRRLTYQLRV